MAKRRNPKKEKALRNQAYARKFRKRSSGRFSRRRQTNSSSNDDDNNNNDNSEETEQANNN
jgi:hypothetical protein